MVPLARFLSRNVRFGPQNEATGTARMGAKRTLPLAASHSVLCHLVHCDPFGDPAQWAVVRICLQAPAFEDAD
jgi:hypothetical protein